MSVVNQPEVYRAVLKDPAFRSKVKAEIYGEHPSGLTALLPHEDWGNMIVAHPADGDEAMTGRKSTTTILHNNERISRPSLGILSAQMSELWRV